ncbi:MAG TPA: hypothetical protein DD405_05615, partial [Desulfobacteraceae bacterium]|nr:hypothetical protein [Desulfobacteraceae bacterium]
QRFLNFIIAQFIAEIRPGSEIIYMNIYTSLHQRPNTYSMQPLMRLVYGPKSCAISAQLISSPFLTLYTNKFLSGDMNEAKIYYY